MVTSSAIEASGVPGIVLNGIHNSVVPDANEVVTVDSCANVTIANESNDITKPLSMAASLCFDVEWLEVWRTWGCRTVVMEVHETS